MTRVKNIPAMQFALFRIVFGLYLTWHFAMLLPYAPEIYSSSGLLPDASANPTFKLFPSIFWWSDRRPVVLLLVFLLCACSIGFTLGRARKVCALIIWWGWACLFNRNVLTSNPSLSYVGLLLVLTALVPGGEPLAWDNRRESPWRMPSGVYWCAWWLMAVGYTFSGIVKLQSPSWVDGTAFTHLLSNPLARPSYLRELFISLPLHNLATWGALAAEILFVPLSFTRVTRGLIWTMMVGLHLGILLFIAFADLTLGMLMVHLFTFDPDWLPPRRDGKKRIAFYDGACGLCQRSVQTLLDLDLTGVLHFAPLQGETAKQYLPAELRNDANLQTMVYVVDYAPDDRRVLTRSDAMLNILRDLGGLWKVFSASRFLPRWIRDGVYNLVASNRLRIAPMLACRLPTPEESERLLP